MSHICNTCEYSTNRLSNWERHIVSQKHIELTNKEQNISKNNNEDSQLIIKIYKDKIAEMTEIIKQKDELLKEKDKEKEIAIEKIIDKKDKERNELLKILECNQ